MTEMFFGLRKRPFLAAPTLDRYYPIKSHQAAIETTARAIARADGPTAIIGGTGLGKSMVCLQLADQFRRNLEVILLCSSHLCSRRALLQNLLFELRMPYRDMSEGELRLSLLERLQPSHEHPADGVLLVVDEAQTLSPKLLDELRLITNVTRDGMPRVRLVLCGTNRLDEMLGHPQMESLNQRLAARSYLLPMALDESVQYLKFKIEICGAPIGDVFTESALHWMHRATDGVPRLLDQLADQALRLASQQNQRPVSVAVVEAAWAALQQLPLPWSDSALPEISAAPTSVEFSTLEEDEDHGFIEPTAALVATSPSNMPQPLSAFDGFPRVDDYAWQDDAEVNEAPLSMTRSDEPPALVELDEPDLPVRTAGPLPSPVKSAGMGLSRLASVSAWSAAGDASAPSTLESSTAEPQVASEFDETQSSLYNTPRAATPEQLFGDGYESEEVIRPGAELASAAEWEPEAHPEIAFAYPAGHVHQLPIDIEALEDEPVAFDETSSPTMAAAAREAFDAEALYDAAPVSLMASASGWQAAEPLIVATPSLPMDDSYGEILEEISAMNLQAMAFDPVRSLAPAADPEYGLKELDDQPRGGASLSRTARHDILSFADLQHTTARPPVIDDRDLLVIEEDIAPQVAATAEDLTPAAVHPYKQLFSRLRGM